jgi:spore coat polysaccharide biosynthesis protein SpsF
MIGVAVQARMSSTRLPAKVLLPVAGRPLLGYVLERVALAGETVVVATSDQPDDDPVAQFASDAGVQVFRGSLPDVAGRFAALADSFGLDALVRVSGDSPLIDPALVDEAISLFGAGEVDLVTNVFPRSFPVGQSVEVLSRAALDRVLAATDDPSDREHVTRYVYAHHKDFRIQNFAHERDVSHVRHVVDTEEDLRRVEAIFAAMDRDHTSYGVDDLLRLGPG